jgi:hypothetical protein
MDVMMGVIMAARISEAVMNERPLLTGNRTRAVSPSPMTGIGPNTVSTGGADPVVDGDQRGATTRMAQSPKTTDGTAASRSMTGDGEGPDPAGARVSVRNSAMPIEMGTANTRLSTETTAVPKMNASAPKCAGLRPGRAVGVVGDPGAAGEEAGARLLERRATPWSPW